MGEIDGAFRSWGLCRGGTGAISNAIADAARKAGAEIRTEAAVERIVVKGNKACGVVLKNGDEISAGLVASSVDPRLTFLRFLERGTVPDDFLDDIHRYKFRGSSGLYMCGSATHPGGGIMGAPGRNAAMKILSDWRR
jgi:phytoene dehydrogenase-like protein